MPTRSSCRRAGHRLAKPRSRRRGRVIAAGASPENQSSWSRGRPNTITRNARHGRQVEGSATILSLAGGVRRHQVSFAISVTVLIDTFKMMPAKRAGEDALYDSQALRGFANIELGFDPVPDATTVLHFRHWLERHDLTRVVFDEVGAMLEERGLLMRQGTIVDATIVAAAPSTKNKTKTRGPGMHQTKKGNQIDCCRTSPIKRSSRWRMLG